jgi:sucrose phosphorylase
MADLHQALLQSLQTLYGQETGQATWQRLQQLIDDYKPRLPPPQSRRLSERDAILITYGDMVQEPDRPPLQTLSAFLRKWLSGVVNGVHILPFYPYSSDDGFSVTDYKEVRPDLGTWADVVRLGEDFRLMFDAVVNHISMQSEWFRRFKAGDPKYKDYFTVVDPDEDLSEVFRPRALPLLTEVKTADSTRHVWTTFSNDQIDLNYANPDVLLDVMDVLLFYASHGAEFIRLDAIAFIWKEIGTACIHLPQTHRIIQLMRTVLDIVAPQVILITETNVPHKDNISYFGDGTNEAQMVYNFTLPPLMLHAFQTGRATFLTRWARDLTLPSDEVTFFNFLASHDGIGLTPLRGILDDPGQLEEMAERVQRLKGFVSYRNVPGGGQIPYELNVNYLDALGDRDNLEESHELKARRFLAAQAIMLALRGVPGIYFHSLFGSRNWREGVAQTGRFRTINRQKLSRQTLEAELNDADSLRYRVFHGYRVLLRTRAAHAAFHPHGGQTIIDCHGAVFALVRTDENGRFPTLCLHNVSNQSHVLTIPLPAGLRKATTLVDLLDGSRAAVENSRLQLTLAPYQVCWLSPPLP